jgi:rifampicin phosphotransferase
MTPARPQPLVLGLDEVDRTHLSLVGGKGANLGDLSRIGGIRVPAGFCVTTEAFTRAVRGDASIGALLDRLSSATPDERGRLGALSAEIRQAVEGAGIPDDVSSEIAQALAHLDDRHGYAVRSSATAEDLPTASFAGQHDSYLHVLGTSEVLDAVRRCWASLFTERAIAYRARHGIDHHHVHMAVVVQEMLRAQASGVLFTADPVTANRKVSTIEAVVGLGEALVSGSMSADVYRVRDGGDPEASIADKAVAIAPAPGGGTRRVAVDPGRRHQPALSTQQIAELVAAGQRLEAHVGTPQDVEWCVADDQLWIVQSRPITTLFPVPPVDDDATHVYVSVGHQQMMTDAMKPLGLSFWQKTTPAPMTEAGGRLFVDVTDRLGSPTTRAGLLGVLGRSDPLISDALQTLLARDDVPIPVPDDAPAPPPWATASAPIDTDPAIVEELIARWRSSLAQLRRDIRAASGPELFPFIAEDIDVLRGLLFDPRSLQVIMAAIDATWWLTDNLADWLGDKGAADTLTLSAPHNVTSEMGLALLDVADAIRPHPEVVELLERADVGDDGFLDELASRPGGKEARQAIEDFLDEYGMRCIGEIDITRPRWSERPAALVPVLLGHIRHAEPGERERRFEQGRRSAATKEQEVLAQLRSLPDGDAKAEETKQMIDRVRTFIGYREYPKYAWVSRFLEYKRALLQEAERLHAAGALDDVEDVFFLTFDELHQAVRTGVVDRGAIAARRASHRSYEALTPPRVLTSDGEALTGHHHRHELSPAAIPGVAVSAGIVEGRARVVLDMADAEIDPGDILVTVHTDPSWSPLFVSASGLVTEVGGIMTHGAVVAREYGLPAVVGVEGATQRIPDGARIRLNGTDGFVELLDDRPGEDDAGPA